MTPHTEPYPKSLTRLAATIAGMPGVNRRAAEKIALSVATRPDLDDLAQAVREWREAARHCRVCNTLTDAEICPQCRAEPWPIAICVVETQADAWAIQKTSGVWKGSYHILGGAIDPANGVLATDLHIEQLLERVQQVKDNPMSELLLATSNTTQGNLTAQYLAEKVAETGITTTVLSRGIANGGHVQAQAPATLKAAFNSRSPVPHR